MIEFVIEARRRDLGGFDVGRLLPFAKRRMIGPFIFLDRMGPIDFPPGISRAVDVRPHPHIGLATMTYLFDGEIMHRDSIGSEQPIRPGDVNLMIAGRGITHSERFERARREGGPINGVQSWVALPIEHEETEPAFAHHSAAELPTFEDSGVRGRIVAGEAFSSRAPVRTHSPLFYVHVELPDGGRVEIPREYSERAACVVAGSVEVDQRSFDEDRLLVFEQGRTAVVTATTQTVLMLLGGEPVGERFIEWNFVSSSPQRIEQAKADWRAGRMKLPDRDNEEYIPLPLEPGSPPNPMS